MYGFIDPSLEIRLIVIAVAPLYVLWLIIKYSKPGEAFKYRKIGAASGIVLFYSVIVIGVLHNYYPDVFEKYRSILTIAILGILFLTVSVICICSYRVRMNDDYNRLL